MTRYKAELKKIHRRKVRKAKEKIRLFTKGELTYERLPQRARELLTKRKKPVTS